MAWRRRLRPLKVSKEMKSNKGRKPKKRGRKRKKAGNKSGGVSPRLDDRMLLAMGVPRLLTVKEAAAALRMSRNGVMNLIARGQLPSVQVPGGGLRRPARVLVDKDDLCEYIGKWKQGDGKSVTVL
jgi:excisionase family DNA binding protein